MLVTAEFVFLKSFVTRIFPKYSMSRHVPLKDISIFTDINSLKLKLRLGS